MRRATSRACCARARSPLYGGAWAENVIVQLQKAGFPGADLADPPDPRRDRAASPATAPSRASPTPPSSASTARLTVEVVRALAEAGAGGAVCFASGFREAGDAAPRGPRWSRPPAPCRCSARTATASSTTSTTSPLWPDQHGGTAGRDRRRHRHPVLEPRDQPHHAAPRPAARLPDDASATRRRPASPTSRAAALDDPRVTALGLHVEGFGDIRAFEAMAARARALGKPVVVLKAGRTRRRPGRHPQPHRLARRRERGRLRLPRPPRPRRGRLPGRPARDPEPPAPRRPARRPGRRLGQLLGRRGEPDGRPRRGAPPSATAPFAAGTERAPRRHPRPARHASRTRSTTTPSSGATSRATTAVFAAVLADRPDLAVFVLDLPRPDRCDRAGWLPALTAIEAAHAATGTRTAVLASLPENLDEATAARLAARGIAAAARHGRRPRRHRRRDPRRRARRRPPPPAARRPGRRRRRVTLTEVRGQGRPRRRRRAGAARRHRRRPGRPSPRRPRARASRSRSRASASPTRPRPAPSP